MAKFAASRVDMSGLHRQLTAQHGVEAAAVTMQEFFTVVQHRASVMGRMSCVDFVGLERYARWSVHQCLDSPGLGVDEFRARLEAVHGVTCLRSTATLWFSVDCNRV